MHGPSQASVSAGQLPDTTTGLFASVLIAARDCCICPAAQKCSNTDSRTPMPRPALSEAAPAAAADTPARPRQPAWAAATALPRRLVSSTGRQSATMMVHTGPAVVAMQASAHSTPSAGKLLASSRATCVPCTCCRKTRFESGLQAAMARSNRRRLEATASGLSPTWSPRLRLSKGAALQPPRRVVQSACTWSGAGQSGMLQRRLG